jgi:calcium-dependent protein kinase
MLALSSSSSCSASAAGPATRHYRVCLRPVAPQRPRRGGATLTAAASSSSPQQQAPPPPPALARARAAAAPHHHRPPLARGPKPVASVDYVASAADEGVLGLPPRTELQPPDITHVFGYPRDLTERYYLGRVLGAGSFGVVREAIGVSSGLRHAVKTIPKAPKRGPATPR